MIISEEENIDRVVGAHSMVTDDTVLVENKLRPKDFSNYIGQKTIKESLSVSIEAAKKRGETLDHVLLHGAPGLGKTTLANIISKEIGANMKVTSGPALDKQGDVASIISNLNDGDVLFIDEIHRLKPVVEEVLYTAMEDFGIDVVIGKGPSARSMRINLPNFTLIGATTKVSMLSSPLRDRFGNVFKLEYYDNNELKDIILRSASLIDCNISSEDAYSLAVCSRNTPRIANRLLKRVRDFSDVKNNSIVTKKILYDALLSIGVDELGLDSTDMLILDTIVNKFSGGPVGLSTLAAATGEDSATIEEIYEPFLIQLGFLQRTPRGRMVTDLGLCHLKK